MKKRTINQLLLAAGMITGLSLSACNSGSGSSGGSTPTQAQIQADGSAVLADGTRVKMASRIFSMDPEHYSNTKINISGTNNYNDLGLIAVPVGNSATASLSRLSTDVGKLKIGAPANSGSGFMNIVASNLPGSPIVGVTALNTTEGSMIKAAYIDMAASGAAAKVTSAGYKAANVIIFGFADTTSTTANSSYASIMQTAINSESAGTVNFLSIGGQYATTSSLSDTATVVDNVDKQIQSYNSQLKNGSITGVDLDLENGIPASIILALAKGFSEKGYLVSGAPQVYLSSGSTVNSASPTNLVLTSGGESANYSTYTPAIASGYMDYIFVQTYNTSGFTIDGYSENQVGFYAATAKALSNLTESSCSAYLNNISSICIPEAENLVIGTVANAGGASNSANIFGVAANGTFNEQQNTCTGGTSYNQSSILSELKTSIDTMLATPTTYKNFDGVMMWSLNTDYWPQAYNDCYATTGGFSSAIYGAESSGGGSTGKYFIMQVSNTASSNTGSYPYATATLVINGAYYEWGGLSSSGKDTALGAGENKSWGTLASAQDPNTSSYVTDSNNLDVLLANSDSFTVSQVLVNTYSDSAKTSKGQQYVCKDQLSVTKLEAGHSYNVMVNPNGACALQKVN